MEFAIFLQIIKKKCRTINQTYLATTNNKILLLFSKGTY